MEVVEELLALVGRAVYADGKVEEDDRELVKAMVRALAIETDRAREILAAAKREAGKGRAKPERLWDEAEQLLRALPPGSGRRRLAARVGRALAIDEKWLAALVRDMAHEAESVPAAELLARLGSVPLVPPVSAEALQVGLDLVHRAAAAVMREEDPAAATQLATVLDAAEKIATAAPEHWTAAAETARDAVRWLAPRHDWKSVRTIEKRLAAGPRASEEAVAAPAAAALAAWGRAALAARADAELARARDRLARLAMRHDQVGVRREYAGLLAALVASVVRDHFPAAAEGLLAAGLLEALARDHWEDRELTLAFASACPDIQLLLIAAREEAEHRKLLARLSELAQAHPRDEELALHLARGVVHVAVVRAGELAPARRGADPLLLALRGTLDGLLEGNPGSARLAELAARFERQPGAPASRVGPLPIAAAARPRHPDLLELRDAFERLQLGAEAAVATLTRVLGVGPYLGRVMREGEEAYQRDETYFLDLLEEVDRQVHEDRSGYWRVQSPKLDTMTRYMLEDATPAIVAAARALRARLNFAAK